MRRYRFNKTSVTTKITTNMENISNVKKLRLLFRFDFVSTEHCVLMVFRFDVLATVWGAVNGNGAAFVIDFNDDRLLGTSSMDNFCDNANETESKCLSQFQMEDGNEW